MAILLLGALILAAAYWDIAERRIPNRLNAGALLAGLAANCTQSGWSGALWAAAGAAVGFAVTLILYLMKAVGAGDVKLFAAIGSIAGIPLMLEILIYAVFTSAIAAVLLIVFRNNRMNVLSTIGFGLFRLFHLYDLQVFRGVSSMQLTRFPFMLAVLPAVCFALWL